MYAIVSLLQAVEYIEARLAEALSPEEAAKAAHLSVSQLNRLFSRVFDTAPAQYIVKRRLCAAARALGQSDRSVTEIALDAQFSAPESFTRAFRRQFLVTPTRYRRDRKRFYELYPPMRMPGIDSSSCYDERMFDMSQEMGRYDLTEIKEAIAAARGTFIMLIDLDRLKELNDTKGHAAGDAALAAIAARAEKCITPEMSLSRIGKDEFIILTRTDDRRVCDGIAQGIVARAAEEVPYPEGVLRITASIGIAAIPSEPAESVLALDRARAALRSAKRKGRNRFAYAHDISEAYGRVQAAKGTYILLADVDRLKEINDTLGYAAGDAALAAVEARIRRCIGPAMAWYRTGGDEYTVLTYSTDRSVCEALARALISLSGEDVFYPGDTVKPGGTIKVSASIGIAAIPEDVGDPQIAVDRADEAMTCAKRDVRGTYRVYLEA